MGKLELAEGALLFERDWYLRTGPEMREIWVDGEGARALPKILPFLKSNMREAVAAGFNDHVPTYEWARLALYGGWKYDINTKQKFNMGDFYLYPPLHREIICKRLEQYFLGPKTDYAGLAIFITRGGLKTYLGCLNLASWLLTRHRVLFDDYTTIRVISAIEDEAIKRTEEIKNLFQTCAAIHELYPEMIIPPGRYENATDWDIPGRAESGNKSLDPSMRAIGAKSTEQGSHPTYTIIDDLEGKAHMTSQAIREETETFFGMFQYSEDIGSSRTLLLGTFYHPASIHAKMVENKKEAEEEKRVKGTWDMVLLPGVIDEGLPTERLLYPTRLGYEEIEKFRQHDIATTGSDLPTRMNVYLDFRAASDAAFAMDRWHEFDPLEPANERETDLCKALENSPCFVQCDFAGKDDSTRGTGDYNAIWVIKYPRLEGQVQPVAVDCHYDDTSTLDEAGLVALDLADTYGAWAIIAEESPSHKVVGQALHRLSAERGYRYYQRLGKGGKMEGNIVSLTPRQGAVKGVGGISSWKMSRMMKLKGLWNAGQVWLADGIDALDAFKTQVRDFPFCKPDDLLDAFCLSQDERVAELVPTARLREPQRRANSAPPMLIGRTGLAKRRW